MKGSRKGKGKGKSKDKDTPKMDSQPSSPGSIHSNNSTDSKRKKKLFPSILKKDSKKSFDFQDIALKEEPTSPRSPVIPSHLATYFEQAIDHQVGGHDENLEKAHAEQMDKVHNEHMERLHGIGIGIDTNDQDATLENMQEPRPAEMQSMPLLSQTDSPKNPFATPSPKQSPEVNLNIQRDVADDDNDEEEEEEHKVGRIPVGVGISVLRNQKDVFRLSENDSMSSIGENIISSYNDPDDSSDVSIDEDGSTHKRKVKSQNINNASSSKVSLVSSKQEPIELRRSILKKSSMKRSEDASKAAQRISFAKNDIKTHLRDTSTGSESDYSAPSAKRRSSRFGSFAHGRANPQDGGATGVRKRRPSSNVDPLQQSQSKHTSSIRSSLSRRLSQYLWADLIDEERRYSTQIPNESSYGLNNNLSMGEGEDDIEMEEEVFRKPSVYRCSIPSFSGQRRSLIASVKSYADSIDSRQPSLTISEMYEDSVSRDPSFVSHVSQQSANSAYMSPKFVSRRLRGPVEKPWLTRKHPGDRRSSIIMWIGFLGGFIIIIVLMYLGWTSVVNYDYCPVLLDNFNGTELNTVIWKQEVQVGGFGNGEFEWTTTNSNNSYVKDGSLWLVPTLTNYSIGNENVVNGYTLNLTESGQCTSDDTSACVASSNTSLGQIIPPVQSARLNTRFSANIRYGKIEVRAKLPTGDWLWPAIWMMPVNGMQAIQSFILILDTYGPWPASGEIDIMESRGNSHNYPPGGNNVFASTLHWGPTEDLDAYYDTHNSYVSTHSTLSSKWHTYGLEWTPNHIMTYFDGRLRQVLFTKFNKPFWQRGNFPATNQNGTRVVDPWPVYGPDVNSAPFGGKNGYFPDGYGKPWNNNADNAMQQFWTAATSWLPTWPEVPEDRGFGIDSVIMSQWVPKGTKCN